MSRLLIWITATLMLAGVSYLLGRSQAKVEVVTRKVEVIKYVEKKKAGIYTRPNASRNDLLELMHNNQL